MSESRPGLARLTRVFFVVGNTTFGGGNPTMAVLQRELVDRRGWIGAEDYALAYALARITPGTNVLAFCAAVATRILGLRGAIAAVLAVTVPSAILAVLITRGYESWRTNPVVMAAIGATVAAVAGMMWASVWLLVVPYVTPNVWKTTRALILFIAAFLASWRFGITPIPVIVAAALAGYLLKE